MNSPLDKLDLNEKRRSTEHHEVSKSSTATIKLDGTGLPLVPQPITSDTDPLNYPNVRPSFLEFH